MLKHIGRDDGEKYLYPKVKISVHNSWRHEMPLWKSVVWLSTQQCMIPFRVTVLIETVSVHHAMFISLEILMCLLNDFWVLCRISPSRFLAEWLNQASFVLLYFVFAFPGLSFCSWCEPAWMALYSLIVLLILTETLSALPLSCVGTTAHRPVNRWYS